MAHFAQLDENNIVLQVIVVHNDVIQDLPFPDSEPLGIAFCQSIFGPDTRWAQTSYNENFRYNYASAGATFDPVAGAFIAPCPGEGWSFNASTYTWTEDNPAPLAETI